MGRTVVRRLTWPPHVRVVAVGGATLGGSGKTPLAIACAVELAARGARVAYIGHGYRATPGRPRVVGVKDTLVEVGDEALLAARALGRWGVPVVVGPHRADAVALAARLADVLVLDGVAQTTPLRASLALLAVDSVHPWGRAAALPPGGDLRAPRVGLLDACDRVVAVGDELGGALSSISNVLHARLELGDGVHLGRDLIDWATLAPKRLGLLTAMARPDRVVRALERRGLRLSAVVRARDHGPFSAKSLERVANALPVREDQRELERAGVSAPVDLWLATAKCALHAAAHPHVAAKLGVMSARCVLPPPLSIALCALT